MVSQHLGATYYLRFTQDDKATGTWAFNDTLPDSVNFTVGDNAETNSTGGCVAYCFANKKGYSKVMTWEGNGSTDGTFLYTGFRPAYFMYKVVSGTTGGWGILDIKSDTFNPVDNTLVANTNAAITDDHDVDFNSNGLKIRSGGGNINLHGKSYMGIAFAEFPFVSSNSIPTTAR